MNISCICYGFKQVGVKVWTNPYKTHGGYHEFIHITSGSIFKGDNTGLTPMIVPGFERMGISKTN
jgi:hypothetical protein